MSSAAVKDFFRTGYMPNSINATKMVVLAKVNQPTIASDFRPISCCNVIYKCVSKLLWKRLKEVLPSIIHPFQAAFIKGREILYNVLISHDLTRGYQRKNITPKCILKVDLQKAFDSVHWEFLTDLLHEPVSYTHLTLPTKRIV